MSRSPQHHDPELESQAALWAAKIDGASLTAADKSALDAWLAAEPSRRDLLSQYCQFSADLELLLPELVSDGAIKMPPKEQPAPRFTLRHWLSATALACLAVVLVAYWGFRPGQSAQSIVTPAGQRQTIALEDGTRVELDARTNLVIEHTPGFRHVRLVQGQAYFEVAKDKSRPFVVETPSGSVRVTGTIFDVRSDNASQFEVTVVEGSVQARPAIANAEASAPVALTAGKRLSAGSEGVTVTSLSAAALEDALAWRQGQIVLDRVPLREALAHFAHHNGRGVSVTPQAGELRIGGRYSLDDFDGFCAGLEDVLPVKVSKDLSGSTRVSLRSEQ